MTEQETVHEEFGDDFVEEPKSTKSMKFCCCCPTCIKCPGFCPCSKKASDFHNDKVAIDSSYKPNRWPQDVLCILLFAVFWCGMVAVAVFAVWSGNPLTLIKPTDYQDNMCGYAKGEGNNNLYDLSAKPVLWYPFTFDTDISESLLVDALDLGICVESCPNASLTLNFTRAIKERSIDGLVQTDMIICNYPFENLPIQEKIYKVTNRSGCFVNIFPTTPFTQRCIPNLANATAFMTGTLSSKFKTFINSYLMVGNYVKASFGDLQTSWFALMANCFFTLILCFVLVLLIRLLLKVLIYTSLFLVWITMAITTAIFGYWAYDEYQDSKVYDSNGKRATDANGDPAVDEANRRFSYVLMAIAGVSAIILIIYSIVLIVMLVRIKKAIGIIQVASRVVFYNAQLLIVPPIMFAALIGITAYWMVIAGYIASATQPVTLTASELSALPVSLPVDANSSYTVRKDSTAIQVMQIYHLFGYFWTAAFISALGYCTISGVIAQWYFSATGDPDKGYRESSDYKKKAERLSVIRSFLRAIIFHAGSILFGSLLVAIIQIIRYLFRKFEKWLNRFQANKNAFVKFLLKLGHVVLFILEWLVKFFNKNAYIVMMIHGTSFIASGARAFQLILTNILIVGTVTVMGNVVLFLIQIMVTCCGGIFTYVFIYLLGRKFRIDFLFKNEIKYIAIPTLAGAVISFFVAGIFINLYSTSIDTILLCYCEDRRRDPKNYPYTPYTLRKESDKLLSLLKKKKKKKNNDGDEKELKEEKK